MSQLKKKLAHVPEEYKKTEAFQTFLKHILTICVYLF